MHMKGNLFFDIANDTALTRDEKTSAISDALVFQPPGLLRSVAAHVFGHRLVSPVPPENAERLAAFAEFKNHLQAQSQGLK
jgi:hypothetical protein